MKRFAAIVFILAGTVALCCGFIIFPPGGGGPTTEAQHAWNIDNGNGTNVYLQGSFSGGLAGNFSGVLEGGSILMDTAMDGHHMQSALILTADPSYNSAFVIQLLSPPTGESWFTIDINGNLDAPSLSVLGTTIANANGIYAASLYGIISTNNLPMDKLAGGSAPAGYNPSTASVVIATASPTDLSSSSYTYSNSHGSLAIIEVVLNVSISASGTYQYDSDTYNEVPYSNPDGSAGLYLPMTFTVMAGHCITFNQANAVSICYLRETY